jgi:hypothetical protein
MLASQEGLCSMDLVTWSYLNPTITMNKAKRSTPRDKSIWIHHKQYVLNKATYFVVLCVVFVETSRYI